MRDHESDRDFEPRERAPRRERGPGIGLTLVGAGLLTAVGFALGGVVGASFEDPDLLVGSLAGRGEQVELGAAAEPAAVAAAPPPLGVEADGPAPDFGAAPAAVEGQVDAAAQSAASGAVPEEPAPLGANSVLPPLEPEAVPIPAPPAPAPAPAKKAPPQRVAAVASGSGFSVQVGAFQDRPPAAALSDRLERGGFPAYVSGAPGGGGQRWRVRVGPVGSRGEADALAKRLKREEGLPTWVVADGR
jgi:cell division septation protein DedD